MIEKNILRLSECPLWKVVLVVTMIVLAGSVPIVYLFTSFFKEEYTFFLFMLSGFLPLILTPPVIMVLLRVTKDLRYFKKELAKEIEKNKQQDIILFEQARFVLMGEMLANISHQWKQPLNTIGLSIVTLKTSENCPDTAERYFDIMENNVNYLASTIDDFMSFFDKKTNLEKKSLEFIVKEIDSIVSTHISHAGIDLKIEVDDSFGKILIASSISQVVLNLINNAKDAIAKDAPFKEIKVQFITNEFGLEIECCDTGKGISEEIQDKIFDPYFTTKEKSQGTGIGLYMSKEIVQKVFDGRVNVSSRSSSRSILHPSDNSNKTCFYIALPYSPTCVKQEGFE